MNRPLFAIAIFFSVASSLLAYEEWSLPNLDGPTLARPFSLEGQIQHQFLGRIDGRDKFDRFFGVSDGADACFTLRCTALNDGNPGQ
jgi:hypothetical protein